MPHSFQIETTTENDQLVVLLAGDLDLTARPVLTGRILPAVTDELARVTLDMEQVTFCDSSGLGGLLDIRRAAGDAGVEMVLRNVPRPVARVLDLTDVDGWIQRE
jgi:anti-sigma B factor antagonist